MMKKLLAVLVLIVSLSLTVAYASNIMSPHRLAVIGGTRPTLVAETGSYSGSATFTRTISVNPPVGTSLMVVYINAQRTNAHTSFDLTSLTFGGTNLDHLTDFAPFGDRVIDGFAYRFNPTSGAQDLVFTTGTSWNGNIAYVWMFSGTPADPFGQHREVENLNATSVSTSFQPEYNRPYIVSGAGAAKNAGGGDCWSGTNLTITAQGRDDTDDVFGAAADNDTLTGAGNTTFTLNCTASGTGHVSGEFLEIVGP